MEKKEFVEEMNEYNNRFEFVWGIKGADGISGEEASFYTLNDIDINYDRESKNYLLGVETAYAFEDKKEECKYLNRLLEHFTEFMEGKGYDKNHLFDLWMGEPASKTIAKSIPELYTSFRIFVTGFNALYGNEKENG